MLRGLANVRYHAADHDGAKRWYAELLGIEPYFERPGYAEFRVGDYQHELGLMDSRFLGRLAQPGDLGEGDRPGADAPGASGVVAYWHVDDVAAALERLVELGATEHEPVREFGEGFVGAAVVDPFGNIVGVMQNAHYLEVLVSTGPAAAGEPAAGDQTAAG